MPIYHFEQFFATRTYWDWAFSPDGREVTYVVDTSGQLNLWRQVDICGPSNLVTLARTVPPFWKTFMATWLGDPDGDRASLIERSPITRVDRIRAPLLVIQGAKDPRVVKAESDPMVEAIRARDGTVEYIVYEDEGHGLSKRRNQLSAFRACAEFLERYLKAEG